MNNYPDIKPEINPEHPRIKNRTPDQQKYRDDLAQILKANRQLGDAGRRAARVVLKNESESAEYISAKENIPEDLAKDRLEYISRPEDLKIDRILEKSKGVSHKKIAKLLIEKGNHKAVARNLEKFEGLNSETAKLLIEKGRSFIVAENLEKFEGVDHKEIAKFIIEKGAWRTPPVSLVKNLEKFEGLDSEIAKLLIEKGYWSAVINNLKKFKKLDSETVELLIKEVREAEQRKNDWTKDH